MHEILQKAKPETTFTLQRVGAKIWADKRPLYTVKILSENEARISWEEFKRIQLNIDLGSVEPLFAQAVFGKGEKWT